MVGLLEVPEKFRVGGGGWWVVGGLLHFSVYLSPLRGEMSRTKSTRQVLDRFLDIFLDMFLDIFLDRERRQETRRGDRLRQMVNILKIRKLDIYKSKHLLSIKEEKCVLCLSYCWQYCLNMTWLKISRI